MSAIHPFLALNTRNGTPQARQYVNTTPTSFGATFGSADTISGPPLASIKGYVPIVRFGGSNVFLATVGGQVYRSTNGGTSWTSVYTFSPAISGSNQEGQTGLWII